MTTGTGYQNGRAERRPPMTAEEAMRFNHFSPTNAAIVASALPCGCEPYQDVYTYNRWLGLGMQVQRGSKAVKLAILKEVDEVDEDGPTGRTIRVRAGAAVFCRHQVAPVKMSDKPTRATRKANLNKWRRGLRNTVDPKPEPTPEAPAKLALTLSYGSTVIGHDGPARAAEPDNAAVDALMAGFEVLA